MSWVRKTGADKLFRAPAAAHRAKPDPVPGPEWFTVVSRAIRRLGSPEAPCRPRTPTLVRQVWPVAAAMVVAALLVGAYALLSPGPADPGWPALIVEDSGEDLTAFLAGP
ncbi:hypothetical protein [Nitrospira sp. Kam-Ns4a]